MPLKPWPQGHRFAFTVVDDTDWATIPTVKPVYDLLARLGLKTTKTAWAFRGEGEPVNGGATCEDADYVQWLRQLQEQGFEIALHNAAPCTSGRHTTQRAFERFEQLFGLKELLFCNHVGCRENIYWGDARISGWHRLLYNLLTCGRRKDISRGHIPGDPLFWGDLCLQKVRYVRNFVFNDLNALAVCPELPYHDPGRPWVKFWFPSANGSKLETFLANFTTEKIQQLEAEGGLCIAYVHFGGGFVQNGTVHPEFERRMEWLAGRDGWFAPCSQILDWLRDGAGLEERKISPARLRQMERRWIFEKLFTGTG